ncbi:MAG: dihydropteroate synthase-like protein [Desulfurococcales archaeon]|nr:dihydropteroate synthase-like protein [Desulfurococcales archaeon]
MKILLITTQAAEGIVKEVVSKLRMNDLKFDIYRSNAQVACLASVTSIVEELRLSTLDLNEYDLVIIPGLMRGSAKKIEEVFHVPAVKGTLYAGDLPQMIEALLEGVKFSPDVPADVILKENVIRTLQRRVESVISSKEPLFWLGNVKFVVDPPPVILFYEYMVEDGSDLGQLSHYLRTNNVEGVIVGCDVECGSADLMGAVSRLKSEGFIVGLDVQDFRSVPDDVISELDIVMNVDENSLHWLGGKLSTSQALVLIPSCSEDVLNSLTKVVSEAFSIGLTKVIVDPLIRPPMLGFSESIKRFIESKSSIKLPHLFGMPNFYELVDADTSGVIASLMPLSFELGASVVLLTESSHKSRGAVKEAFLAREMVYRAFVRKSPPVDVGIDLLIVKEKVRKHVPPPPLNGGRAVTVSSFKPYRLDPKHYIKVYVDSDERAIVVDVHDASTHEVKARFTGSDPLSVGRAVVEEFNLPADHALYLGFELSKAEIAMRLRKGYVQDEPVITFRY